MYFARLILIKTYVDLNINQFDFTGFQCVRMFPVFTYIEETKLFYIL